MFATETVVVFNYLCFFVQLRVSGQLVSTDTVKQITTVLYPKCHPQQKCYSPKPVINVAERGTGSDTLILVVWNISYTRRTVTRSNADREG